ncbi:probable inactive poly [ADP-ribose] polymerase SRO1 isoform X2 [Cornus florida]|uniref:probable inactive poly [ADP-ribose] polymerase SRO1 isoform X2 n=1 Tax=Cornus florida TaxID=4283 RepID=UPI0028A21B20|nr:probable inactive poly [ADP-ribose] polymerase SRO1 isoform X2 [Cornus florida]XP_059631193.1 probable inactive poly [ADP-ribose] polymerase SRO1 isoform X2 [Cornus florida]XP_059631194.1 probable inactive poly [ADP-ribose] polymerase SRO1 isoform X2 [Cornus florida]
MDSNTMEMLNHNQVERSIVDKIRVRVPPKSSSSSSSSALPNRNNCFGGGHDCCYTRFLVQNHSNFKRSGPPTRFMSYRDGSWSDFSSEVFGSLQSGFLEGKPVVDVGIGGIQFLFDFYRMLQIDCAGGCQRSIAWMDVDGNCFFPKEFVDGGQEFADSSGNQEIEIVNVAANLATENPKIEIEIRIGEGWNSSKRNREAVESEFRGEEKAVGSCSSGQGDGLKKQRLLTSELESPRWPKAKLLKEGQNAYSIVKNLFLSGIGNVEPGATITSIHQYTRTGPFDRARYEVFQKQMELTKAARGESHMSYAWHGTSAKGVASIFTHGFGVPNKVPGPGDHGVGIYLSPVRSPQMSALLSEADDNGEKHVILCRVILGKCEKVEAGSRQLYPSSEDFDTGVDDLQNPKWYVVWCANMNSHILPECVVSYKSSDQALGLLNGSSLVKSVPNGSDASIVTLFSKLRNFLPPSKLNELRILCSTYKDGKLAKGTFIKLLRIISSKHSGEAKQA